MALPLGVTHLSRAGVTTRINLSPRVLLPQGLTREDPLCGLRNAVQAESAEVGVEGEA